jgi:starch synthase
MEVLHLAAEVAPYAKAGGLADVVGSLPFELSRLGVRNWIVAPFYRRINTRRFPVRAGDATGRIKLGKRSYVYRWYSVLAREDTATRVAFIANRTFFHRSGIYTRADGTGYPDNTARFFFFQLALVDLLAEGRLRPDLIHCHDHHTALVPWLLRVRGIPVPTLLTVHNFQYQGEFTEEELDLLGAELAAAFRREFAPVRGRYRSLEVGLRTAARINTVSPTYARETLTSDTYAFGLKRTLQAVRDRYCGILNGADYRVWNPEVDPFLEVHYSPADLSGKATNKRRLLAEVGLPYRPEQPVIGSVSRLVDAKGFDLILAGMDDLMKLPVQLVFLGRGMAEIVRDLRRAAKKYPDRIAFTDRHDEALAHLIEAGADLFLMPSRYEPCGLSQIYSLKYGTIPIVRKTGGLADTVQPWDGRQGTGFVFTPYRAATLVNTVRRALRVYRDQDQWRRLVHNAMAMDFSWARSAGRYLHLYRQMVRKSP